MAGKAALVWLLAAAGALQPMDEGRYRALIAGNRDRVLLVDFWATWCEPCRAEMPEIAKLERRLAGRRFTVATISTDEPEQAESARKVIRGAGLKGVGYIRNAGNVDGFIGVVDPKWSGALPAMFLYDRSGRLVRSFVGEVDLGEVEGVVRGLL